MARTENRRIRVLYVLDYLKRETDEEHAVTAEQIVVYLQDNGINAERKSIYADIAALKDYGFDIINGSRGYYLAERDFELPELRLLVDAVQSSKFITDKKSRQLIDKLEKQTSGGQAAYLRRQVHIASRVKTENEEIYYTIDCIHNAIASNRRITFLYYEWTLDKVERPRRDGMLYTVSPIALIWSDDNYYLLGVDARDGSLRHYRTDKIKKAAQTDEERRLGEEYLRMDVAGYAKKSFGMYGGDEKKVTLLCDNSLIGVIMDRFGSESTVIRRGDCFETTVTAIVSPVFISWICMFGDKMEVLSPAFVREKVVTTARGVLSRYEEK